MRNKIEKEVYFTPKQAAAYFNLSLSTVKNYIYAGKLKTLKTPGGHHRIRKSELLVTLGDGLILEEKASDFSLEKDISTSILSLFKLLGRTGDSLEMHSRKVSALAVSTAKAMNIEEHKVTHIEIAGLVHDIGHIGVDRAILLKTDSLNAKEYGLVKRHPEIGKDLLNSMKYLKDVAVIVGQHHERVDGNGYPQGLAGEGILEAARIISIAEAYDSMIADYSYKIPISRDMAVSELMRNRGTQFDGEIVEVFIKNI